MPTAVPLVAISHCSTGALTALWLIALIASTACGLLVYSIASFRAAPDAGPASFVRHTAIEVLWAMIPILILISTAMPSVQGLLIAEHRCSSVPATADDGKILGRLDNLRTLR